MRGSLTDAERPGTRPRLLVAIAIGAASALLSCAVLAGRGVLAADFTWPWRAAGVLLAGGDPYTAIVPVGPYPFDDRFLYPLPAAIVALPVALLRSNVAGGVFVGVSAALLAWGLTRDGWQRLPLFLSGPFLKVVAGAQWSPLMLAAALLPGLQWLAVAKPNLGLVSLLQRPTWKGAIGCVLFLLLSLALMPRWPAEWLANLGGDAKHPVPLFAFLGPLLLLALLRWRTREGRLLLTMAIVPQELLLYDQLALWLIPRRWWVSLGFAVLSWPALLVWAWPGSFGIAPFDDRIVVERLVMATIYMPALVMVLLRPDEGSLRWPILARRAAARDVSDAGARVAR